MSDVFLEGGVGTGILLVPDIDSLIANSFGRQLLFVILIVESGEHGKTVAAAEILCEETFRLRTQTGRSVDDCGGVVLAESCEEEVSLIPVPRPESSSCSPASVLESLTTSI